MKKYRVIGIMGASVDLGVYEAASEEEAIKMAYDNADANHMPTLCHHCAGEVDLGDIYKEDVHEE